MPTAKKKPTKKKAATKKAASKKAARKPAAKKSAAKKKAATKKAAVKKTAKKGATKAPAHKKAATKKAAAQKKTATKAAAPKAPARKRTTQVVCPLSGLTVTPGASRLAPSTRRRLRKLLEDERAIHLGQAEDLRAEADELTLDRDQGDTQFDEESGEGDTLSIERERSLLLSATARQAVEEIDRALARLDEGTYGVCVPAGRPISLERLEAIPWAETCVECAQRVARRR